MPQAGRSGQFAADTRSMGISSAIRDALTRAIDEAATEFVYLTDATPSADGGPLIVYMNRAMLEAYGYEESDVVGHNSAMFWGPQTDKNALRELRRNIREHRESGGEYATYRRDGSVLFVRFRGRVLHVEGAPAHWIAIGSDITEARRQREQIEELSQFRMDLIAMLAHDFGGPLTAVSGFAELLLDVGEGVVSSSVRDDMLRTIRREVQRLANFATDTLTVSRMESEHLTITPETFNVAALLREIADLYSGRGVVALHVPAGLTMYADRARMRQALDNLVGNAIKYSPNQTPVVVDCTLKNGEVIIAVRDNGIGIPSGQLEVIFERYARGSNARANGIPGTGFGLFLAQAIVGHHCGRIDVQSTPGHGSTFSVHVPQRLERDVERARKMALL